MFKVGDCVQFKSPHLIPNYSYFPVYVQDFIKKNQNKDFQIIEKSFTLYAYRLDCTDSLWFYDTELKISDSTNKIDNEFVEMLF